MWEKVKEAKTETERVNQLYRIFQEDQRLKQTQAASVEFITTTKYIEKYLEGPSKVCDIGAGTGVYSFYLAQSGHTVTAVELADANIEVFQEKLDGSEAIDLVQGNALDLSFLEDHSFDLVLLLGPLYHLESKQDQLRAIKEAQRICKPNGKIIVSFISNDMVMFTELGYNPLHFNEESYDHEQFIVHNFPFVFHTLSSMEDLLETAGTHVYKRIGVDGMSELLADKINQLDESGFSQYLKFHLHCCEDPHALSRSNHVSFVIR